MNDGRRPDSLPDTSGIVESDDAGLLAPRAVTAPRPRRSRNWGAIALLVAVVLAGGLVLTKFLTSAIDYYCNVDEVGTKSGCEADRRLRVQGTVDKGSVSVVDGVMTFSMSFRGASLDVRYVGDPGGIFQECIPVVVHGEIVDTVLQGDRVEVKHSEEYEADNGERLTEDTSTTCS